MTKSTQIRARGGSEGWGHSLCIVNLFFSFYNTYLSSEKKIFKALERSAHVGRLWRAPQRLKQVRPGVDKLFLSDKEKHTEGKRRFEKHRSSDSCPGELQGQRPLPSSVSKGCVPGKKQALQELAIHLKAVSLLKITPKSKLYLPRYQNLLVSSPIITRHSLSGWSAHYCSLKPEYFWWVILQNAKSFGNTYIMVGQKPLHSLWCLRPAKTPNQLKLTSQKLWPLHACHMAFWMHLVSC